MDINPLDGAPWKRLPSEGLVTLAAHLPAINLAGLHAVARARMAAMRSGMLALNPVLRSLAEAIERRDAPALDWAEEEALLAAGQAELRQIQAGLHSADRAGVLATEAWFPNGPRPVTLAGAELRQWQATAARRLERLIPAVLALEQTQPARLAAVEALRAARIAALARKLVEHSGISWHLPPDAATTSLPPPVRAVSLEARGEQGATVRLHWRHDSANGMEWLRWQAATGASGGKSRQDGSVAGRAAVMAALQPLALAA